jgi:hypothetical protein
MTVPAKKTSLPRLHALAESGDAEALVTVIAGLAPAKRHTVNETHGRVRSPFVPKTWNALPGARAAAASGDPRLTALGFNA